MTRKLALIGEQAEWLAAQFDALTTELDVLTPSQWAEQRRYLPPSVTPMPGFYRFDVAPYLREIVDCLSVDSPVREVALMKGVQVCATVGILENAIGYCIDHVRTAPVMLLTADSELAKLRLESYITPMLQFSGLEHLIKSADEKNTRKTGKTDKKIEWVGGGFLIPFGAQNANKLRSFSVQYLLRDEVDGYPLIVGKDGDPMKLSADRTAAYEGSRKVLDLSTPTVKGQSAIERRFEQGDQRYYHVCCLKCGTAQTLRWRRHNNETGEVSGFSWKTEAGRLVPGSVRYLCEYCGHPHTNDDKTRLLSPDYGAHWKATAVPASPDIRSYHLSALYSPVGMQTWDACVKKWLEAWDDENNVSRDNEVLQVFYNNVLGEPFRVRGDRLRFEQVSSHRREYCSGQIPNKWAARFCGGPILLLTCSVDVHKDNLAVSVFGWCRDRRAVLVSYERYVGDTSQLDDPGTWGRLRKLLEEQEYVADDGKRYRIMNTLVDSGYIADTVYQFASSYASGVYPVKGRELPPKAARIAEFSPFTTPMGTIAYGVTVDLYKDRWSAALRRSWDGVSIQPDGHFNAPVDVTDKQLKELTAETKVEKRDGSKKLIGYEWRRPSGAANELWDTLIYANAALDMLAWDLCVNQLEMEAVSWPDFYRRCEQERLYFTDG